MTPGPGDHEWAVPFGGGERGYLVHVPPGHAAGRALPAVLMLHGAGGTARWTAEETRWPEAADRGGFLAVFPEGTPADPTRPPGFLRNPQLWNDGSPRSAMAPQQVDDVAYIRAVLDDLGRRVPVNERHVYLTGFSNGAGMTFRLGAELADRFAAIAPVAGHCWQTDPVPSRGVPTLYLVGDSDPLVPLHGGEVVSPWTRQREVKPPVRHTLETWARALGCPLPSWPLRDEGGVHVEAYGPGRDGAELVAQTVAGLGHHWPGGRGQLSRRLAGQPSNRVHANDLIWEFFRQHKLG